MTIMRKRKVAKITHPFYENRLVNYVQINRQKSEHLQWMDWNGHFKSEIIIVIKISYQN